MAWEKTITILWAAIATVWVIITKWKEFNDALPSLTKAWKFVQRKLFSDAVFKKQMAEWMEKVSGRLQVMQDQIDAVVYEVKPNGSKSMNDKITRTEASIQELMSVVIKNKAKREIVDTYSPQMIFEMDENGSLVFINDTFLKHFGWQEHEVTEYGFENIVHEEDRAEMVMKWQLAITRKTKFYDEQRIADTKGVYHKVCVKAIPMKEGETLTGFYGQMEILDHV